MHTVLASFFELLVICPVYDTDPVSYTHLDVYKRQAPTMDAFKRLLADGPFHLYMDDSEFVFIEYYADTIRYNASRRYMRFSNEAPLVYYTFIALLQFEVENLINIDVYKRQAEYTSGYADFGNGAN